MLPLLALPVLLSCAQPAKPSVLLITLDTTRADRLGCYGYMLAETPTLDRLASEGTRFARAYSSAPLTIPSHSTIMTGRAPPTHGVRDNGDYVLPDSERTLAERFSDGGWQTLAFTAAFPTQARWGFDQGFDVYHDPLPRLPTALDWSDERTADLVVDDAIDTLSKVDPDAPTFVWVHLFDAHWPYAPPPAFRWRHRQNPYDGEIAFIDSQLERLIAWWDRAHPDSVVVVTADHGEGHGDGGERTHGFLLYDGTIRVPLIMRARGALAEAAPPAGTVVHDPVGHVDIAPTLLDLAGLPLDEGLQGHDLRAGGSRVIYSEATTGWLGMGLAPLLSWTGPEGRYTRGSWDGFYPAIGDQVDVQAQDATQAQREQLDTLVETLGDRSDPTVSVDPETAARLAALGYMGGVASEPGDIDPRDVIDVIPRSWEARQLISQGKLKAAAAALAELEARLPGARGVRQIRAQLTKARGDLGGAWEQYAALFVDHPSSTTTLQLARLSELLGDPVEAQGWYEETLHIQPNSPEAMGGLVRMAAALGEPERARDLAERYLQVYPDHAELKLALARLELVEGEVDAAVVHAEDALSDLVGSAHAWQVAAECQWAAGRPDPAIERLFAALRLDPFSLDLRLQLVAWLLDVQRSAEASRVLDQARAVESDDPAVAELAVRVDAAVDAELGHSRGGVQGSISHQPPGSTSGR